MKNFLQYIWLAVKGACMGAANVIPGVSGGTIALLTGIYERFVHSISSFDMTALKLFFTGKFRQFFKYVDGGFLVAVLVGVALSTLSLAKLLTTCLHSYPVRTWAFFFGLIIASSILILKDIKGWKVLDAVTLAVGIALGVLICTLTPAQTPDGLWFIFLSGAIAVCAMVLPGISGSFLLLVLGKYEYIMGTLNAIVSGQAHAAEYVIILVFLVGAVVGILAFSKLIDKLLQRWFRPTLLVLAGFIIGSLVKVWPWYDMQTVLLSQFPEAQMMLDAGMASKDVILVYHSQIDMHVGGAILFALIGIAVVLALEWLSARAKANREDGEVAKSR